MSRNLTAITQNDFVGAFSAISSDSTQKSLLGKPCYNTVARNIGRKEDMRQHYLSSFGQRPDLY